MTTLFFLFLCKTDLKQGICLVKEQSLTAISNQVRDDEWKSILYYSPKKCKNSLLEQIKTTVLQTPALTNTPHCGLKKQPIEIFFICYAEPKSTRSLFCCAERSLPLKSPPFCFFCILQRLYLLI